MLLSEAEEHDKTAVFDTMGMKTVCPLTYSEIILSLVLFINYLSFMSCILCLLSVYSKKSSPYQPGKHFFQTVLALRDNLSSYCKGQVSDHNHKFVPATEKHC